MDIQMVGILWLIGAFLFGLLNCYFGYRLFMVTVAIVGFLMGASLGYAIGVWTGNMTIGLIAATVLGMIAGWASIMAYYAFIFVVGAFGFALASAFLAGLYSPDISVLIPIIAGTIGGFLAFWLQRIIIIVATATQGALASILALAAIIAGGGVETYRALFYRLLEGELTRSGSVWFFAGLFFWLILAVTGLAIQFRSGKEMYRRQLKQEIAA